MKNKNQLHIIAGPCSAESREQLVKTAQELKAIGIDTFRAGLWKPRSHWGTFEGRGAEALPWMKEVQNLGMKVMTEVALPAHVEAALKAGLDQLWIGARTVVNPFMMDELASALQGTDIPVFVKNPVCPDLELWAGGLERLMHKDVKQLRCIYRGFSVYDPAPFRNSPLWPLLREFRERFSELPMYYDPSHIAGKRELIPQLIRGALNYPVDGFFIESHICPDFALSDAAQQLTPHDLKVMLDELLYK